MLLEVVLSLALLAFGLAVVGVQVNTAFRLAQETDMGTRAAMLMESKYAELQGGVLQLENMRDELEGDFGIRYPGFTWRLQIEECEIQDLYMVQMDIGYNPDAAEDMIDRPETTESKFTDAGTRTLLTTYRLYPKPADINVQRDYGYSPEEINEFLSMAGGTPTDGTVSMDPGMMGGDGESGDGSGEGQQSTGNPLLDALQAAGIDADMLQQLMDPNGFDPRKLTQLSDEDFMKFATLIELLQGQGNLADLQQQLAGSGLNDVLGAMRDAEGGGGEFDDMSDMGPDGPDDGTRGGRRGGTGRTRGGRGGDRGADGGDDTGMGRDRGGPDGAAGRGGGRRGSDDSGTRRAGRGRDGAGGGEGTDGGTRAGRGGRPRGPEDGAAGGTNRGAGGRGRPRDNADGASDRSGRDEDDPGARGGTGRGGARGGRGGTRGTR